MIETDQQRRWWFATHPEYSHRSTGKRGKPDDVSSKAPHLSVEDRAKQEFIDKMMNAGASREWAESRWRVHKQNESIARSTAWAMNVVNARAMLQGAHRWAKSLGEAGTIGNSGGPGNWIEVRRGKYGLEHQSKMSGQPIRESGGKYYINEYEVNGVKFDDYRDGVLYEYKGNYSNFIIRKLREFYQWFKGAKSARNQALRQADAAQGVPVKWRVGPPNQVEAFKKAVGDVPGVTIEP